MLGLRRASKCSRCFSAGSWSSVFNDSGSSRGPRRHSRPSRESREPWETRERREPREPRERREKSGLGSSFTDAFENEFLSGTVKPDWNTVTLPPIEKVVAVPETSLTQEEADAFYREHKMTIQGTAPKPIMSIDEAGLPQPLVDQFRAMNFEKPTPVQSIGWPLALSGQDMVAIAETGSGKTLSFLLPALLHIDAQRPHQNLRRPMSPPVLVVCPTRELAVQIGKEAERFISKTSFRALCVYGGTSKGPQLKALRQGVHMVIGTPGRITDLMNMGCLNLTQTSFFVADEADRMLDMGFEPQLRGISDAIRPDRQTLFWSATWPKQVAAIAKSFASSAVRVNIGSSELTANPNVSQFFRFCSAANKNEVLLEIAEEAMSKGGKILVFVNTKNDADDVSYELSSIQGARPQSIHGDKSQNMRDRTLESYRMGKCNVLVATNVAARGIDVKNVTTVINYGVPAEDDYVHRIGRTGRAGAVGDAYTIITPKDVHLTQGILKVLRNSGTTVPPELEECVRMSRKGKEGPRRNRGPPRSRSRAKPRRGRQERQWM